MIAGSVRLLRPRKDPPAGSISRDMVREFKDVVFEDVVFDDNRCVTIYYIVVTHILLCLVPIIIKHHILKHHIFELRNGEFLLRALQAQKWHLHGRGTFGPLAIGTRGPKVRRHFTQAFHCVLMC